LKQVTFGEGKSFYSTVAIRWEWNKSSAVNDYHSIATTAQCLIMRVVSTSDYFCAKMQESWGGKGFV